MEINDKNDVQAAAKGDDNDENDNRQTTPRYKNIRFQYSSYRHNLIWNDVDCRDSFPFQGGNFFKKN